MADPVVIRFIGPHAHGSAVGGYLAHVLDAVRPRAKLRTRITASGGRNGLIRATLRLARTALAAAGLVVGPRGRDARLYLPIDTSLDLDCAVLLAMAGRLRGYRMFIHDVRGRWQDQPEGRYRLLDRLAGTGAVHVLPSEELVSRLRWVYRTQKQAVPAPRPVALDDATPPPRPPLTDRPLVMGVILDVGPDPAVSDAMNTFVLLRERLGSCRLIAVGQPVRRTHAGHIEDAVIRYEGEVEHRGRVDAAGFRAFLRDIDVLLLPARATHDTWPPGVVEAMAMGVPVIARAEGCIRSLIGDHGGVVIEASADYPRKVLRLAQSWRHDPSKLDDARRLASERGQHIARLARQQFDAFLDLIAPR